MTTLQYLGHGRVVDASVERVPPVLVVDLQVRACFQHLTCENGTIGVTEAVTLPKQHVDHAEGGSTRAHVVGVLEVEKPVHQAMLRSLNVHLNRN